MFSRGDALKVFNLTLSNIRYQAGSYRYDEWHVVTRIPPEGLDVYKPRLLEVSSHPLEYWEIVMIRIKWKLTVRSLTSVDFPAPFGPTIPTRLCDIIIIYLDAMKETYLDKESAQLTLKRLGVFLPG